ncbi:CopG family ribbon-helix-helix protein [Neorhizobium galegae]|uniref:CopG family ribbon-helix-helix protein n=1 Tax=Neorhizobium galegae TaxID=399 RepID=UPI0006224F53|nr:CopG family ribbon-helix-helix protein [Neorhizobium galegae]CDZ58660.1 Transcriptional regulator, CopG family [Neorhizobium galegae bv. orientalis]KAB1121466.1 ribbon-helix-helix protein, CopG family [Neorhizobium galegae]MCQ1570526.1 CopG family ribbon-helix-helix protein [Neorhizobium galegae]MCQ1809238.1 CopG family ribbon-helix-helix protein [Neorhizobium galegae]MCQ1838549.1 CopG family ribbon-helix-helix protein [Neorhizobium galegae]
MTAFTIRVPDDVADRLNQLAQKLDRSRSYMAAQAIEDFVSREEWQLEEIEAGIAEADRGEFASDDDLARVVGKYVKTTSRS